MGIRISMRLVVGVDNFDGENDKRFSVPIDWTGKQEEEIPLVGGSIRDMEFISACNLATIKLDENRKATSIDAYGVFYVPTDDYGCKRLFGITVAELPYAHDVLFALTTIFQQFNEDGFVEVGKYGKNSAYAKTYKPDSVGFDHMYKRGLDADFQWWQDAAMWYLKWIEFNVNKNDLRLFLEWHWS